MADNLTIRDFSPFIDDFKYYTLASSLDCLISIPIYFYALSYMFFRSANRMQKYRFVITIKVVWNFLYEQFTSGLAPIWFSPALVSCPTGWLTILNIPPIIWQSISLCLTHTLPVSISHLYFYRMKSALWPHRFYSSVEKIGAAIYTFQYLAGFIFFPIQIYHAGGKIEKHLYSRNLKGLPQLYWSNSCYTSARIDFTSKDSLYLILPGIVTIFNAILVYFVPILSIIFILCRFRNQNNRNAKSQRDLLYGLFLQTLVYIIFYVIPTQTYGLSIVNWWFNPLLVQFMMFVAQMHGSFVTITLFITDKTFFTDLKRDFYRCTKNYRKSHNNVRSIIVGGQSIVLTHPSSSHHI